jgi:hypothetical protein
MGLDRTWVTHLAAITPSIFFAAFSTVGAPFTRSSCGASSGASRAPHCGSRADRNCHARSSYARVDAVMSLNVSALGERMLKS